MEPLVTFLCKRTAVSSESMQPGEVRPLSALDLAMEPFRIRAAYYYARCPASSGIGSSSGQLKESLAELLNSFRPIAGRLQRTAERRWALHCTDAGVRMVEATAEGNVEDWLRKADRNMEMKLAFWEDMYENNVRFWSPCYIQLTRFQGGGLALGISCSHMVADAVSLAALVTAWAHINLLGKALSLPCFEPLIPPPPGAGQPPSLHLVESIESRECEKEIVGQGGLATATFTFSDAAVRSVVAAAGESDVFAALAALFWTAIDRAKGKGKEKEGSLEDMIVCANSREALKLSSRFFGNATVFAPVRGRSVKGGTLEEAAKAVADAAKEIDHGGVILCLEEDPAVVRRMCRHRLVCANWEGLTAFSAVFEKGESPLRVSYHLEPVSEEGHVLVMPAPATEEKASLAREVAVTLPAVLLSILRQDSLLLDYKEALSPSKPKA